MALSYTRQETISSKLFVRKARGLALTEEGARFLQYARRIKQLADQSVEDISKMNEGLTGRLYLATVEGHAPELFANWISEFKKKYPMVEYEVWNGNSDDVIKRVHSGLNEVGVITLPYELTSKGVGIAIYPASAAKYVNGGVVIKRIIKPDVTAGYVLVKSAERDLSKVAMEFWDMVNEMYDSGK